MGSGLQIQYDGKFYLWREWYLLKDFWLVPFGRERFAEVLAALPRANRVFIRINTIRIKTRFLNKADHPQVLEFKPNQEQCEQRL